MAPLRSILLLASQALVLALSSNVHADNGEGQKDCGTEHGSRRKFCAEITRYAELMRLPGYALAVAHEGKIVYLHTGGYANLEQQRPVRADSIFPIASVTKTFTAAVMMQYVDEQRIGLDDYLADYPQFADAFAWPYSSADIRVRHVLSQTSEGSKPGAVFTYNGNRFNQVYGVFVKMSGERDYARAFSGEVQTRILDRLGLRDTLTQVPEALDDPHTARLITPYRYDTTRSAFVSDDDLQRSHKRAYPNSGMLSTLSDLARYVDALDQPGLLSKSSDATMAAAFTLNDGTASPYALGWFAETAGEEPINWVYGLGPSYSSFVLRVTGKRVSLIFLANNDGPTAALRLNYGNALQFPLVASFLRTFVKQPIPVIALEAEVPELQERIVRMSAADRTAAAARVTGMALTQQYVEQFYGAPAGRALTLVAMLRRADPGHFRTLQPDLIGLIAALADPSLIEAMNDLAAAYSASGRVDPRTSRDLGDFYDKVGLREESVRHRSVLVAAPGYETNDATILSAFALGDQYFVSGDGAAGRKYYWIGIRNAVSAGWGAGFAEGKRQRMNELSRSRK